MLPKLVSILPSSSSNGKLILLLLSTRLFRSKMKSAKRHLNDRLAELSRCLDHNSDDEDAVLEPSSRPYALLTHIPELTDKFGTFARPPSGRNAVNFKAGRKKTSRKRVVEDLGDSDEAEKEEEDPKPERKKPKTRQSSRKEITADEEEPAAPSTSSKRKPRLGGTPSDASELDDQPSTSSLLTPHYSLLIQSRNNNRIPRRAP